MEDTLQTVEISPPIEHGPLTEAALDLSDEQAPGSRDLLLNLFGAMKKAENPLAAGGLLLNVAEAQLQGTDAAPMMDAITSMKDLDPETATRGGLAALMGIISFVYGVSKITNKDYSGTTKVAEPAARGAAGAAVGWFSPEILEFAVKNISSLM